MSAEPSIVFEVQEQANATAPVPAPARRLDSVDWVRGIIMVVMLLDHTRDFVHVDAMRFQPTDLDQTTPVLFFTRWVTHFCAPVFVFLAGTSIALQSLRGKDPAALSRFLVKRGLWLMAVDLVLISPAIWLTTDFAKYLLAPEVIWVIGVSMVILGGLIRLPVTISAVFGVGLIALHHVVDGVRVAGWSGPGTPGPDLLGALWMFLHQQGVIPLGDSGVFVLMVYPLVPWLGVMAAGYAFGHVYRWSRERRQALMLTLGAALIVGFVLLRALNVYGDQNPWAPQQSAAFTVLSFLNVTKQPPSLLFAMMTLGPALVALAVAERVRWGALGRAIVTLGRVPLFYFVLQWPVVYLAGMVCAVIAGRDLSVVVRGPAAGSPGFSLGVVYLAWVAGLLVLYPLCRWYAGVKQRSRAWWVSYL